MPSGPKNQKFMNRHAAEAKAREDAKKQQAAAASRQAAEEAMWEDDDKATQRKLERQREREEKAAAKAERKAENKELFQTETKQAKKEGKMAEFRRLQAEIHRQTLEEEAERKRKQEEEQKNKNAKNVEADKSIIDKKNNKKINDDDDDEVSISISAKKDSSAANAQTLEDILKGVDPTSDEFRRKMGKRAKVLYQQFCDDNMKKVREENPSLRRTQINDVLWQMWQENAQNPFVQRKVALKAERLDRHRRWMEGEGDESEPEGEE